MDPPPAFGGCRRTERAHRACSVCPSRSIGSSVHRSLGPSVHRSIGPSVLGPSVPRSLVLVEHEVVPHDHDSGRQDAQIATDDFRAVSWSQWDADPRAIARRLTQSGRQAGDCIEVRHAVFALAVITEHNRHDGMPRSVEAHSGSVARRRIGDGRHRTGNPGRLSCARRARIRRGRCAFGAGAGARREHQHRWQQEGQSHAQRTAW